MNRPLRVSIINFPVGRISNEPGLKAVMRHLGTMPNMSLLYVAAVFMRSGAEVQFIEAEGLSLSEYDILRSLRKFSPDLVCFTIYTSHFHEARRHASFLKKAGYKVMAGGIHPTLFPRETMLAIPDIDYLVAGEAEVVLPGAVRLLSADLLEESVPGLWRREGRNIIEPAQAPLLQDLDLAPFPARELIPNEIYSNFISTKKNYTVMNTSRGCPYSCIFCEAARKKWRMRSAASVVSEFALCLEKYGIREIDIFDSSFSVNRQRVLDICSMIKKKGLEKEIIWDIRSRVDSVDEEMLVNLKEAGCYRIFFGIESGDDKILKTISKSVTREKVRKIISLAKKLGISTFGYFLVGSPGETPESHLRTLDFAKSLPLDFCIFNKLTAFPETALYRDYYMAGTGKDFWREFMFTRRPLEARIGRPWTELTDEQLDKMAYNAMLSFYFRPLQIVNTLRNLSSYEQLMKYIKAGIDMLLASFFQK